MTDIELDGVAKRYRGRWVLGGIDLALPPGTAVAITGPNGAGKSVLLKIACLLVRPDRGMVRIAPEVRGRGRDYPEHVGVLINGPSYLPGLTAEANLLDLAAIRGEIGSDEVDAALDAVGLERGSRAKARAFSMGMKQKLGLAQAIMERPRVLILDEPFTALDRPSRERVTRVLRGHVDGGGSLLFSSHSDRELADVAGEVWELADGRLTRA